MTPYTIELRKRFWWCAYCFDRCVCMLAKLPFSIRDVDIDVEEPVNIDEACTDSHVIYELQRKQSEGIDNGQHITVLTTMSAAIHHLHVYRIRSTITTRFTGPGAEVPLYADVLAFLSELEEWKHRAPMPDKSTSIPCQSPGRIQATYLQAVLVLIRPILLQSVIDPLLLTTCAQFAADACDSSRSLSLSIETRPCRITAFHTFFCGITLLQCLTVEPTVLSRRRMHQAISSCLSSLSVYTRTIPAIASFLYLFEELSNRLVGEENTNLRPNPVLRELLNKVVSSDPSETLELLQVLPPGDDKAAENSDGNNKRQRDISRPPTFPPQESPLAFQLPRAYNSTTPESTLLNYEFLDQAFTSDTLLDAISIGLADSDASHLSREGFLAG
nr:fungal specific transcription factor domain-containing protein [Colletotrichum truncatum]KAF6802006.1 fungal specific transcription factor domain-containing protein [Colletotrichum truncatum]